MTVRRARPLIVLIIALAVGGCVSRTSASGTTRIQSPSMSDASPVGSSAGEAKEYLVYDP